MRDKSIGNTNKLKIKAATVNLNKMQTRNKK